MRNKMDLKLLATGIALASVSPAALAVSLGSLASGHGVQEVSGIFSFASILFAFLGFMICGGCLLGMAMIKMAPNNPATQKFEQAGMGGLLVGALLGAGLTILSSLIYFFMGTIGGDNADSSPFEKLRTGAIHQEVDQPASFIASNDIGLILPAEMEV